ncbi:hypothetical protein Rahaq_4589 (plasmid) [Rahnella aceris]|jgi:hypothetical protein|uniref:Uncharacterized protein n=1 Tax=Rahnella sp. (strain Y9602) TaxID=2703885 RepID=A0A0H3FH93_RAHSY|nr:hypothetical protein Rahaq_4589 [Rahnella aceris]
MIVGYSSLLTLNFKKQELKYFKFVTRNSVVSYDASARGLPA